MSRTIRARTVAATASTVLLFALTGCGDDDPPAAEADPSTSPSASSPSAGESGASESASATPDDDVSSTVAPATGPVLEIDGVRMNAPDGWKPLPDIVEFSTEANPPSGIGAARLSSLAFVGSAPSLDTSAKIGRKSAGKGVKRLPDVEIGGEMFYHLAGQTSTYVYYEKFGTVANGYDVTIAFDLQAEMPEAERQQIVEASLASFSWR